MIKFKYTNIFLVIVSSILGFILCEIILMIYNPFPIPNRNSIFIRNNYRTIFKNKNKLKGIDNNVIVTINKLGFRGLNLPEKKNRVVFMGGSTTECILISDNKDWPNLVYNELSKFDTTLWMNNAGVGGNSTYGNLMMIDYVIKKTKPNYIVFMVGINDIGLKTCPDSDKYYSSNEINSNNWLDFLLKKSQLFSILRYLIGPLKKDLATKTEDNVFFSEISYISDSTKIKNQDSIFIGFCKNLPDTGFQNRIQKLILKGKSNSIIPIFISQTAAYGFYDSITNKDLTKPMLIPYSTGSLECNGNYNKKILNYYNKIVLEQCVKNQVHFIDLDSLINKSSIYFYDLVHFNNIGCKEVAKVISKELKPILIKNRK